VEAAPGWPPAGGSPVDRLPLVHLQQTEDFDRRHRGEGVPLDQKTTVGAAQRREGQRVQGAVGNNHDQLPRIARSLRGNRLDEQAVQFAQRRDGARLQA
jgi:hypothetical protein